MVGMPLSPISGGSFHISTAPASGAAIRLRSTIRLRRLLLLLRYKLRVREKLSLMEFGTPTTLTLFLQLFFRRCTCFRLRGRSCYFIKWVAAPMDVARRSKSTFFLVMEALHQSSCRCETLL